MDNSPGMTTLLRCALDSLASPIGGLEIWCGVVPPKSATSNFFRQIVEAIEEEHSLFV